MHMQIAKNGGAIKGTAFWLLLDQGQTSPVADGSGEGLYGIRANDTTWNIITGNAQASASGLPRLCCAACGTQPCLVSLIATAWCYSAVQCANSSLVELC